MTLMIVNDDNLRVLTGAVDVGGIGDRAGLKMAQRIVGVNGILIHPTTPHKVR